MHCYLAFRTLIQENTTQIQPSPKCLLSALLQQCYQLQPHQLNPSSPTPTSMGDSTQWQSFLLQCQLYFTMQEGVSGQVKIDQLLILLTGKVIQLAATMWEKGRKPLSSYKKFITRFRHIFDHAIEGKEVGKWLYMDKQGRKRDAGYTISGMWLK